MKKIYYVLAAAVLFVAAAALASCSKTESPIDNTTRQPEGSQTIQFRATLAPKSEGAVTKAITVGTDGNGKEILNVAWKKDEKIAIYYQKTDNSYATATANVESVDSGTGVATITASLPDAKGGPAKFVYPASLANETGDINEAALLNQNGNLTGANGISTKFDAATGEGTITISGSEASVSGTVTMTNRVCICKFHFDIVESAGGASGPEREFSPVIISDGNGHTYTITSDRQGDFSTRGFKRSDDIYIALLPVCGKTVSFYNSSLGSGGYNNYIYTASNTTLTAGKFYRNLSIDMVKDANTSALPFKDLTKGSVSAVDGDIIYMSSTAATANTITIADGATVTIENVNISATGSACIICSGTATINLVGANRVRTMTVDYAGIQAGGSGTTLTILGSGSLSARGGQQSAGIGSSYNGTCGSIVISGGTITAKAGIFAAGIGSGINGKFESITITDGITSVTAEATGNSTYGIFDPIGKGMDDAGSGSVTIDGTTTWTAGTATTHLNWDVQSNFTDDANNTATRWTLTHK